MAVTPYLKQGLKSLYLTLTSDLCEQQLLKKSGTLIEKMKIIKKKVILISFQVSISSSSQHHDISSSSTSSSTFRDFPVSSIIDLKVDRIER